MTTRDEVLAMAREAGIKYRHTPVGTNEMWCYDDAILRFAALAFEAGRKAEREECAKDCVSSNGMPTAAEAFANLKNYIASNTAPASQWRSNELKMHDPEGQHYAGEKLDALQEGDS